MPPSYNIRKYGLKLSISEIEAAMANGLGINQQDLNGCTLLHYAVEDKRDRYARLPIVRFLLQSGANPHLPSNSIHGPGKGPTPIQLAIENGREDLANCMLQFVQGAGLE